MPKPKHQQSCDLWGIEFNNNVVMVSLTNPIDLKYAGKKSP